MANRLENIGLMIRNERLRKGLTQEELGERVLSRPAAASALVALRPSALLGGVGIPPDAPKKVVFGDDLGV